MITSTGLKYLLDLQLGVDELQWLQEDRQEQVRYIVRQLFEGFPGIVYTRISGNARGDAWKVHDDNDDGSIGVKGGADDGVAYAVDQHGNPFVLTANEVLFQDIALANDNTWRTVVMRRVVTDYEPGTLTFDGVSAVVVGSAQSKFTRYAGKTTDGFNRGTKIRVDAADTSAGNAGTYEVTSVASDTSLTLTSVPPAAESGVKFTAAGDFLSTPPADPDIHARAYAEITVVTRTRNPATGYMLLADVRRNDATSPKVDVIDLRQASRLRRRALNAPLMNLVPSREMTVAGSINSLCADVAPTAKKVVCVYGDETNGELRAAVYDAIPPTGQWGSPVTIDSGDTTYPSCAVVRLPANASTHTHLAAFRTSPSTDGQAIKLYGSTNNGASWVFISTVWDPAGTARIDAVHDFVLLKKGRLVLVGGYHAMSGVTVPCEVRYIYSDDYGATWNHNTTAGYAIATPAGGSGIRYHGAKLCQLPDGSIYTIFLDTSTGGTVGVAKGQTELEPAPSSPTSDPNLAVFTLSTTGKENLAAVVSPDGDLQVISVGGQIVTTRLDVSQSPVVAVGTEFVAAYTGTMAQLEEQIGICQAKPGGYHLVFPFNTSTSKVCHHSFTAAMAAPHHDADF